MKAFVWGIGLLSAVVLTGTASVAAQGADEIASTAGLAMSQELTLPRSLQKCTTQSPVEPGLQSPGCHPKYLGVIFLHIFLPFNMETLIRADDFLLQARAGYGCELEKQVRRIRTHCRAATEETIREIAIALDDQKFFCTGVGVGFQSVMGLSDMRKALIAQLEQDQRCR